MSVLRRPIRVSRPCYDKFHRCPPWAGGGTKYAKVYLCDRGYIRTYTDDRMRRMWRWRCFRCATCGVVVLPYMFRWLDPTWLYQEFRLYWSER